MIKPEGPELKPRRDFRGPAQCFFSDPRTFQGRVRSVFGGRVIGQGREAEVPEPLRRRHGAVSVQRGGHYIYKRKTVLNWAEELDPPAARIVSFPPFPRAISICARPDDGRPWD